jgi:HSP20 family protein
MRDLTPWGRSRSLARTDDASPFLSLHRDMNRLFDEAFRGFGALPEAFAGARLAAWPTVELSEHEGELRVTAELPGLDEKDIEIVVEEGVLTLRGEKRTEVEDKDRRYSERSYGRFERRMALPGQIDEDKASAAFKNGVLTITLPKAAAPDAKTRRIEIKNA